MAVDHIHNKGILGYDADHEHWVPVAVDEDGVVQTSGSGGGGGAGDASAANQALEIAELQEITAQSFDLDTGAGSDAAIAIAIALPASGGAVVGGTSTNPIRVDPTGTTTQPVSDAGGSLTVDNATLSVVGGGTEATALRVTLASDSTGVVSIDDNGGNISIDDGGNTITVDGTVAVTNAGLTALNGAIAGTEVQVDVLTMPSVAVTNAGTFAVQNTAATPSGTNLIGKVAASQETTTVYDGVTALTPKFAAIAASSSGNNTVVAAVTSKKIRVLAYNFISNGTVNAKFQTGAGGTDLTGLKYCVANSGICAPFNPVGWFETASGVLLNLNLSAGVAVGGELVYVEV